MNDHSHFEQLLRLMDKNERLHDRETEAKRLLRQCCLDDFEDVRLTIKMLCELFNLEKV